MELRKQIYFDTIKYICPPTHDINDITFKVSGILNVCLIEYRIMDEIEHVLNALLHVYNSDEIGLTIVCGSQNEDYIRDKFNHWNNLRIINTGHANMTRHSYSALLKSPSFWEQFTMWSHVLVYQTDALILRKIDEEYFDFDYIGAPWKDIHKWAGKNKPTYNGGNGGFSLRRVLAMIQSCECNRNLSHDEISVVNEDGFFCSNDTLNFAPENSNIHKQFSIEEIFYENPVGCHQLYRYITDNEFYTIINIIKQRFHKQSSTLIFTLFGGINGVGFYNQIFSLELAIFMSNFFKRELHLIINKPLAALGVGNWNLGTIFDYIENISHLLPYGFKIIKSDYLEDLYNNIYTVNCEKYISSCYYVEDSFRTDEYSKDVLEFANGRTDISNELDCLFDYSKQYVLFDKSNASRIYYNFYISKEKYILMNYISENIKLKKIILNCVDVIKLPRKFISLHIRFGDIGRGNFINPRRIINNITNWMSLHNTNNHPLIIMCDHPKHPVIKILDMKYNVLMSHNLINNDKIKQLYKNPAIAMFLIEKTICERADIFIGTATSTVSVHINYNNYLNYKPYYHYNDCYGNVEDNFDKQMLKFIKVNPEKKWTWGKYNYIEGHPLSWTLFFNDNIYR